MEYTAMERLFQPLLFFLARCSRNQLIRQIEFLKAENKMLRKRVPKQRIWLKPDEKERLLTLALSIGSDVKHLLSIVTYDTIRRILQLECRRKPRSQTRGRRRNSAAAKSGGNTTGITPPL
jgi:hypothetical protein